MSRRYGIPDLHDGVRQEAKIIGQLGLKVDSDSLGREKSAILRLWLIN